MMPKESMLGQEYRYRSWRHESQVPGLFSLESCFPENNQGEQLKGQVAERQHGGVKKQWEAGGHATASVHGEVRSVTIC